mmetsp:Transcript_22068/g.39116  ORF Transcript_22068/g.39116 Transcript_22068/m.39116 type:complete len:224 (-) Transcript_22068:1362-2033(-)
MAQFQDSPNLFFTFASLFFFFSSLLTAPSPSNFLLAAPVFAVRFPDFSLLVLLRSAFSAFDNSLALSPISAASRFFCCFRTLAGARPRMSSRAAARSLSPPSAFAVAAGASGWGSDGSAAAAARRFFRFLSSHGFAVASSLSTSAVSSSSSGSSAPSPSGAENANNAATVGSASTAASAAALAMARSSSARVRAAAAALAASASPPSSKPSKSRWVFPAFDCC